MAGSPDIDIGSVDATELARNVATTPDEQLAEGMRSPLRGQILDEIFGRMAAHFRPENAQGVDAVIHFVIGGRADGGEDRYEVKIANGTCTVSEEPGEAPRMTLKLDGVDFLKLVTGNANGPELFMSGRLKVEGDLMFAASAAGLFVVPDGRA